MSYANARRTSLLLLPLVLIWRPVSMLVQITGILLALLIGFIFMVVGVALSMTVVGAVIGVPLLFLGVMITLRAIY